jgi:hypothetical protein
MDRRVAAANSHEAHSGGDLARCREESLSWNSTGRQARISWANVAQYALGSVWNVNGILQNSKELLSLDGRKFGELSS